MEKVTFEQFRAMKAVAETYNALSASYNYKASGGSRHDSKYYGEQELPSAKLERDKGYQSLTPELQEMAKNFGLQKWSRIRKEAPEVVALRAQMEKVDIERDLLGDVWDKWPNDNPLRFEISAIEDEGWDYIHAGSALCRDANDYEQYKAFCGEQGLTPDSASVQSEINAHIAKGPQMVAYLLEKTEAYKKIAADIKAGKKVEPVKGITKISNGKDEKATEEKATEEASWGSLRAEGKAGMDNARNTLAGLSAKDKAALIAALKEAGDI